MVWMRHKNNVMVLEREKKILNKFNKEKKESVKPSDDVFAQIEKLVLLKEKGLISEEEFNQKKSALLEKYKSLEYTLRELFRRGQLFLYAAK